MRIETKVNDITKEGVEIAVHMRFNKMSDVPEFIRNEIISADILAILRALKGKEEKAFMDAMEHFIEEELSNE